MSEVVVVDLRRGGLDVDGLRHAAQFHGQVGLGGVVHVQDDAAARGRLEARQGGFEGVVADRQELEAVAPTSLVGTVRLKPVSTLRAVTVTPGRAAPLVSVIVPMMVAEVTCAAAGDASGKAAQRGQQQGNESNLPEHGTPPRSRILADKCRTAFCLAAGQYIPS